MSRLNNRSEPLKVVSDSGVSIAIGRLASADSICKILSHPLFSKSGPDLSAVNYASIGYIDPRGLLHEWLIARLARAGIKHENFELAEFNKANKNLSDCLRTMAASDKNRYNVIAYILGSYIDANYPCFEQQYNIITELGDDGAKHEVKTLRKEQKFCLRKDAEAVSAMNTQDMLRAMLVLEEAHPGLITVLDDANAAMDSKLAAAKQAAKANGQKAPLSENASQALIVVSLLRATEKYCPNDKVNSAKLDAISHQNDLSDIVITYNVSTIYQKLPPNRIPEFCEDILQRFGANTPFQLVERR